METREKDYLMRQFHQLATVLARLMGFKENNDHQHALTYIEEAYKEALNLDFKTIKSMPPREFLDDLLKKQGMNLPTLEKMGELLMEEANIYEKDGITDLFFSRSQKALLLLNYVQDNDKTFSLTRKALIDHLTKAISKY